MKKNVLVIAGLAVLSTSAFASKARMEALGQGTTSFYLNDTRSIFLNPAALNDTKNYIITEWGSSTNVDAVNAPRAEGGFFREMGTFAYGLYLGNDGADRTSATAFLDHQNAVDLLLAGDMGVKWGARLHYANSKDSATTAIERKNSAFGIGLGATQGDMEGYLNLDLSDKSTGAAVAGDEWKRKPGVQIGGSYKWSGMNFFVDYAMTKENVTKGTGGITTATINNVSGTATTYTIGSGNTLTHKTNAFTLGAAKVHEVNPTARVIVDGRLVLGSDEISGDATAANNGKGKIAKLPFTFAVEADATSWLVLRGAVSQNVILGETKNVAGKKSSIADSAAINAGATLNFGKLKVDGVIGTTAASRAGTVGTANTGVLATDNLMSRVALTYWF